MQAPLPEDQRVIQKQWHLRGSGRVIQMVDDKTTCNA